MPGPSPHLPAVFFRVLMAGQAAENAIELLKRRHLLQARFFLNQVISNLHHASDYLKSGGEAYDARRVFIDMLANWYRAELGKVTRPGQAPQVADEIYAQQGLLFSAQSYIQP